jgi:hypothetical protein
MPKAHRRDPALIIDLFTGRSLSTPAALKRWLGILESRPDCKPTHWGETASRARSPYDRPRMIAFVAERPEGFRRFHVVRRFVPRYDAFFSDRNGDVNYLYLSFKPVPPAKYLSVVFAFGDALAQQVEPAYGFVHVPWDGPRHAKYLPLLFTAEELQEFGPPGLFRRTYLGPHAVRRIGRKRLKDAGVAIRDTTWGGVTVDLVTEPWSADTRELEEHLGRAMKYLKPTGVFGDYTRSFDYRPGPKWAPIRVLA